MPTLASAWNETLLLKHDLAPLQGLWPLSDIFITLLWRPSAGLPSWEEEHQMVNYSGWHLCRLNLPLKAFFYTTTKSVKG